MNLLTIVDRYWHTLRHLKPIQLYGRLRFRVTQPKLDITLAPYRRIVSRGWVSPARRRASLIGPVTFVLLNSAAKLTDIGWDNPHIDKLWRYNQHYFDDLNAVNAAERRSWHLDLLKRWVGQNPPGAGTGWEPYPTSLRIVNWIKWALTGSELPDECCESLAIQARWLMERLEWHLLGNHLFANAKALVFVGLWFDGPEAQSWLNKGFEILAHEFPEQVLPDGGQFELSPMYHALILEDVLDLKNITQAYPDAFSAAQKRQIEDWKSRTPSMLQWHNAMCHPDGQIAFFNDAAMGVAASADELADYAARLGLNSVAGCDSLVWLADSGYARLSQPRAVLLVDMARVGPNYLPGHAHADTLSFELSLDGQRLFVNSGTSRYGVSQERLRQRSTAAHNTVVVEGRNSSDVWSGFRVGRRAYPRRSRVERVGDVLVAEASHDGYCQLPGRPLHNRRWKLSLNRFVVEDWITAPNLSAEARYHLHPDVAIYQNSSNAGFCHLPNGKTVAWEAWGCAVRLKPAFWHPEFGISLPTTCLAIMLNEGHSKFELNWI